MKWPFENQNALDHMHHSPFDPVDDCVRCQIEKCRQKQEEYLIKKNEEPVQLSFGPC